jgi:catalase
MVAEGPDIETKGVVLLGKFVPSAEASSVSKALHFKHEVPVTVRFSANTGMAKIADADPRASPRGLAIRFRLPDGSDTDLVTHSYNGFPAKNPEEFQQFFLAVAGSKPGVPSPTPIEAFQETHPAAKTFLTTRDPPPVSYATTTYFGVNSFKFVNEKGAVTIGRYQLLPDAGRHFLSKDESAKAAINYLEDEIRQRVAVERSDSRWCCSSQRRATRSTIHRWLGRAPIRSRLDIMARMLHRTNGQCRFSVSRRSARKRSSWTKTSMPA